MLVKVFCWSVIFLLDHGLVNAMACIDLKFKLANLPMSGELWRPQRLHCNGQDSWLSLCHRNQNGENPFFSVTIAIVKETQSWQSYIQVLDGEIQKKGAVLPFTKVLLSAHWRNSSLEQNEVRFGTGKIASLSHPLLPELCPFCLTTKCHDINKCRFRDK